MAPLDGDVKSLALSLSFFLINSSATDKNINCSVFEKVDFQCQCLKHESINGDTIFTSRVLLKKRPPFSVVTRATRRTSRLQGKGSTFNSQLF